MADATPDNTASTPRTRGSTRLAQRAAGMEPHRLNLSIAGSPASTISSITTATSSRRRRVTSPERTEIQRRNDIPLAQLGAVPSPIAPWGTLPAIVAFDPLAVENEYDRTTYHENPGAADSEDELEIADTDAVQDPLQDIEDMNLAAAEGNPDSEVL